MVQGKALWAIRRGSTSLPPIRFRLLTRPALRGVVVSDPAIIGRDQNWNRLMILDCAGKPLDLSTPVVMGILNVTPDSFSDGGRYISVDAALAQAERMVEEGAAIVDIGGESTRPGAQAVDSVEELRRVLPIVEALAKRLPVPVSIDTSKPEVMRTAVEAGAGFINDVLALRTPGAVESAAAAAVPVCVMHMQGEPRTMQSEPHYRDVVADVSAFLEQRLAACIDGGITAERVLVDPGFGFGKTLAHNLSLFRHLDRFTGMGAGVLVGVSRKSMIGGVLDRPVEERLAGSLALATLAAAHGAAIVRVHDVRETVDAIKMVNAVAAAE